LGFGYLYGRVEKGFTLIELMVVVAILGILSAVALPSYSFYITRAKLSEVLALAGQAKTSYSEFYQVNGEIPELRSSGVDPFPPSKLIETITIAGNALVIKLDHTATGFNDPSMQGDLLFTPVFEDQAEGKPITGWVCTSTLALKQKLPSICRG
jgi:type IV pilus assembly protein PilA